MPDTLYFDGKCALCSREIKTLRRLKSSDLTLIDIHSLEVGFVDNVTRQNMLQVLHLKTTNGNWLTGLDATIQAWGHTKLGWIFKPLRWPVVNSIADYFYQKWAARRYCSLYD